ncbi:MAG: PDZ domain-containing protein, partial [Alphaproteobacteria bacterium]
PPREVTELTGRHPLAGAVIGNLSPAFAEELGADPFSVGVVIVGRAAGGPAARFGFRPGDVLERVNRVEIARVADLTRVLARPAETWRITLRRDGRTLRVAIGG